ncbi:MAG: tripartite tricarboxylate transporter substrate-binding protein [Beijerinckiaceae bacterium]|nr:tripartite tricarboxylate transporter substrate-binding protein [Beijerinckiaceae bacterium]
MKKSITTLAASVALIAIAGPVAADTVASFYAGKQMRFIIRTPPGGDYDQLSRLLARHIGRHIPGQPNVTPQNMPGGGGIIAANYVGQIAPQDGTILTMVSQGLPVDQALGLNPSLKVDLRKFNWLGNMANSNQLLAVWHTSPTKTLEDAKTRVTTIGSTGAGSMSVQLPAFYNNILGTKLAIVVGYPNGQHVDLAMERGELEGRGTNTYAGYMTSKPHYLKEKLLRPLLQVGIEAEEDLPGVPLLKDLQLSEADRPVADYMSKAVSVGRPVATTPGVPADRVAALRKAFDLALLDPEFKNEAAKSNAEIRPMSADVLTRIVTELIDAPETVRSRVKMALEPKAEDQRKLPK